VDWIGRRVLQIRRISDPKRSVRAYLSLRPSVGRRHAADFRNESDQRIIYNVSDAYANTVFLMEKKVPSYIGGVAFDASSGKRIGREGDLVMRGEAALIENTSENNAYRMLNIESGRPPSWPPGIGGAHR
jgi:hypothetical protein